MTNCLLGKIESGLRVQLPVIGKAVTNQSSETGRGNFHEIAPIILRNGGANVNIIKNFHFSLEKKKIFFWLEYLGCKLLERPVEKGLKRWYW